MQRRRESRPFTTATGPGSNGASRTAGLLSLRLSQLQDEAVGLSVIGCLNDDGSVSCRECGEPVDRDEDERGVMFECWCGWALWFPAA